MTQHSAKTTPDLCVLFCLLPGAFSLFTGVLCVCVECYFLSIGTKEWYKGKSFYRRIERLEKCPCFLLVPVPVVFSL